MKWVTCLTRFLLARAKDLDDEKPDSNGLHESLATD